MYNGFIFLEMLTDCLPSWQGRQAHVSFRKPRETKKQYWFMWEFKPKPKIEIPWGLHQKVVLLNYSVSRRLMMLMSLWSYNNVQRGCMQSVYKVPNMKRNTFEGNKFSLRAPTPSHEPNIVHSPLSNPNEWKGCKWRQEEIGNEGCLHNTFWDFNTHEIVESWVWWMGVMPRSEELVAG